MGRRPKINVVTDPAVTRSMRVFERVVDISTYHIFNLKSTDVDTKVANLADFPELPISNITEFVSWFDKFNEFARHYNISKKTAEHIFLTKVSDEDKCAVEQIFMDKRLNNIWQLQCRIFEHFYSEKTFKEYANAEWILERSEDLNEVLQKFAERCRQIMLMCSAFNVPCNMDLEKLKKSLCYLLPKNVQHPSLKEKFRHNVSLRQFIEYIKKIDRMNKDPKTKKFT